VLDATQTPMVLYRPGAVTAEQLGAATGAAVQVFVPAKDERAPESLPSPGVGIRHYAPRAKVMLVASTDLITLAQAGGRQQMLGSTIAFLLPSGWRSPLSGAFVFDWGDWSDPAALARNLFAGLRELDATGAETIVVPLPPPGDLYDAIRDRLMKAARE
jgi:L-threonylcarbamoyladenylate synthase